jgi:hypothetical protein
MSRSRLEAGAEAGFRRKQQRACVAMIQSVSWVIEEAPGGKTLVATGAWSEAAGEALTSGEADGLVLNYARGFAAESLDFIRPAWKVRRLSLLDRKVVDLEPLARLAPTLEELSIQASGKATLDLHGFDRLRELSGPWPLLAPALSKLSKLQVLSTFEGFAERDLTALRGHVHLEQLTIKDARYLESLDGIEALDLRMFRLQGAARLRDISALTESRDTLTELWLEEAGGVETLDVIAQLQNLRHLHIGNCGPIESFAPLATLRQLERLYAWGTTQATDGDLTPLVTLPELREIRMRDRRHYEPPLASFPQNVR